jgi:hypothetical protein
VSPSIPIGLAIAMFGFAVYMQFLARRSAAGIMGNNGPGIRIAETKRCEHTWAAAQQVAAPIYRRIAAALAGTAALTIALSALNATVAFISAIVVGFGVEVFFLGVASVRARKAADAIDCEHSRLAKLQRAQAKKGKSRGAEPSSAFSPAHRRKKRRR